MKFSVCTVEIQEEEKILHLRQFPRIPFWTWSSNDYP